MPKQKGPVFYTGTRGDACFYKMDGQYYVRRKSTLSGKRVKRDKAFTLTRVYADLLGQASRLAAAVYRCLPREERKHAQYRAMTGEALRMLKEGVVADIISARLEQAYVVKEEAVVSVAPDNIVPGTLTVGIDKDLAMPGIAPAGIVKEEIVAPPVKILKTDRSKTAVARLKGKRLFMRLPKQVDIHTMPDGRMEIRLTKKAYVKRDKAVIFME
ncbi:hypothetical protein SAMN04488505_11477 [Chitinophaga rupis]|uniref:Uncharacterized protein n=1 Tax=Chitinophaga rupis TaxID=573321 RepID=A0A1H8KAD7_9BACT|nr:hypothetical protein [Chitinophaga rupis]SEN89805.1 hypothetical protein SAMN04488505_11477 [Chitinophaga rupis]